MLPCHFPLRGRRVQKSLFSGLISLVMECLMTTFWCLKLDWQLKSLKIKIIRHTPAAVRPSSFVTFVWDNNDINPESLRGISMHRTNGIVIQSSGVVWNQSASVFQDQPHQLQNGIPMMVARRQKKFVPMALELPAYVQVKRRSTEIHTDVPLNLYAREEQGSRAIDTL